MKPFTYLLVLPIFLSFPAPATKLDGRDSYDFDEEITDEDTGIIFTAEEREGEDGIAMLFFTALDQLTDHAWRVRQAINAQGHPEVDHVELFGAPTAPQANAKSFVLCPGKAYDRSPCGTGTSAKLACLAEDGKLAPNTRWIQESITGSTFSAVYERQNDKIIPTMTGSVFVCSKATLVLNEQDPLRWGLGH